MTTLKGVFRNSISLLAVRVLSSLLSFVLVFLLARFRQVEMLGKFSLVFAYFILFTEFPLLGFNLFISRELSKRRETLPQFFFIGNVLSFASIMVLAMVLFVVIAKANYPADVRNSLMLVIAALLPSGFIAVAQALLIGVEKISQMSWAITLESIARSTGAVLIIFLGGSLFDIFLLFFVCRMLGAFIHGRTLQKNEMLPTRFLWDHSLFILTLTQWPIFACLHIFGFASSKIDYFFLSSFASMKDVGFYSASYKFLDILLMVPSAVAFSIFPTLARYQMDKQENSNYSLILKYFSIVAVPVASLFCFGGRPFITFVYGRDFAESSIVLQILVWNFLIVGCDQIITTLMISQDRQKADVKLLAAYFTFYVTCLYILIPKFGYLGAAVATSASSIVLLLMRALYVWNAGFKVNLRAPLGSLMWAIGWLTVVLLITRLSSIAMAFAFLIYITGYFAGLYGLKILTLSENKIMFEQFARKFSKVRAA